MYIYIYILYICMYIYILDQCSFNPDTAWPSIGSIHFGVPYESKDIVGLGESSPWCHHTRVYNLSWSARSCLIYPAVI